MIKSQIKESSIKNKIKMYTLIFIRFFFKPKILFLIGYIILCKDDFSIFLKKKLIFNHGRNL